MNPIKADKNFGVALKAAVERAMHETGFKDTCNNLYGSRWGEQYAERKLIFLEEVGRIQLDDSTPSGSGAYSNDQLRNMLEDVVNVLDLSEGMIEKHGPLGTPPAVLVREVLAQKDLQIRALKAGAAIVHNVQESSTCKPATPPAPAPAESGEGKALRPPDRESTKIDLVHNGMHLSSDYPAHAFAILFGEYLALRNYEYDYDQHHIKMTVWNEVEDPFLHSEDGPECLSTNGLFIEFEKWVKEKYPAFIAASLAGPSSREQEAVEVLTWLSSLHLGDGDYITINTDGNFYWSGDEDGDNPIDSEELFQLYIKSKK